MEGKEKIKPFYYVESATVAVAGRFAKFYFEDLYDRIEKNDANRTFDIFLVKPKEKEDLDDLNLDIQYWIDFFGKGYRFFWSVNK